MPEKWHMLMNDLKWAQVEIAFIQETHFRVKYVFIMFNRIK